MSETRISKIESRLRSALNPASLDIEDQSHLHAGHAGARDGKGHFRVTIVAEQFADKSLIQKHRLVYEAMGDLMETDVHALIIEAHTP